MPHFSEHSKKKLATCDKRLQEVCNIAIKYIDFSVLYGHRSAEEQFELYKIGRKQINGEWVKVGKVVTYKDGSVKLSYHNHFPSYAVDLKPYPKATKTEWEKLAIVMKAVGRALGVTIEWGYEKWGFDKYHFQIKKSEWN